MKYHFSYQIEAIDFWKLSMYSTYNSMVGLCNVIFTVAMILLTFKFWLQVNLGIKILLVVASCWFIVMHPLSVYIKGKKQVAAMPSGMEISFDDRGIHVKTQGQASDLKWKEIKAVVKKPSMLILFSTAQHGFILSNKVLGTQKEDFYKDVLLKIQR